MFENLSNKLQNKLSDIGRQTKISEDDLKIHLKEIRLILLEADVNYKVAKNFLKSVEEKSLEGDILRGLNPGEQIVKIVKDEMLNLFGEVKSEINYGSEKTIILMAGLQGSGKTTTTGKLALYIRKKKHAKNPLLIAADVYRPAAIDQLKTIGKQLSIEVYSEDTKDVEKLVSNGLDYAKENNHDLVIIDTAGRLHIDEEMLNEIEMVSKISNPNETFLVIDATIGQDSVAVAESFNEKLDLTGVIITKLDGDARGGATMSVSSVLNIPIKFIGVSEKMDGLEHFDPERMVSRILGMGDMLGFIEKVEDHITEEEAKDIEQKMKKGSFTLEDFLKQMKMMKKMGGFTSLMGMIPGMNKIDMSKFDEKEIVRMQAIIESMTVKERQDPNILNGSRRKRIAEGSGLEVSQVNKLIKGYEQSKIMMKKMSNMDMNDPSSINKLLKNLK